MLILGAAALVIGLVVLFNDILYRIICSKNVDGKIIAVTTRVEYGLRLSIRKFYYYPVYEYEVDRRKYHNITKQCNRDENWYKIGDIGKLAYCPSNPERVIAKGYFGEIIYGSVFTIIGIFLLVWRSLH